MSIFASIAFKNTTDVAIFAICNRTFRFFTLVYHVIEIQINLIVLITGLAIIGLPRLAFAAIRNIASCTLTSACVRVYSKTLATLITSPCRSFCFTCDTFIHLACRI